jgi:hypothetical protein
LYAINIFVIGFDFNPVYFAGAATVFLSTYLYFSVTPAASQPEASKQQEAAPAVFPGYLRFPEIALGGVSTHPSAGVLGLLVVLAVVLYAEVPEKR